MLLLLLVVLRVLLSWATLRGPTVLELALVTLLHVRLLLLLLLVRMLLTIPGRHVSSGHGYQQ